MSFIPKYSWLTKSQQNELERYIIEMDSKHICDGEPLSETAEGGIYIRGKAEALMREGLDKERVI